MHLKLIAAVGAPLHINRVVKILGRFAVNRHDGKRPEIPPPAALAFRNVLRLCACQFQDLGRKAMWQVELADHDFHVHAEIVAATENLRHPPARTAQLAGPREIRQLNIHHHAFKFARAPPGRRAGSRGAALRLASELAVADSFFLARPFAPGGNHNLARDALVKRRHVVGARAEMEFTHHRFVGALQHAADSPFQASVALGSRHTHFHAVSVHRRRHAVGWNEDVQVGRGQRPVGNHKAVTVAMGNQFAGRDVRAAGARRPVRPRARAVFGLRVPVSVHQRIVVLLQKQQPPLAYQLAQGALEFARLAGSQAQLNHQPAQAKGLVRAFFKNFQYFGGRWKFMHHVLSFSLPLNAVVKRSAGRL